MCVLSCVKPCPAESQAFPALYKQARSHKAAALWSLCTWPEPCRNTGWTQEGAFTTTIHCKSQVNTATRAHVVVELKQPPLRFPQIFEILSRNRIPKDHTIYTSSSQMKHNSHFVKEHAIMTNNNHLTDYYFQIFSTTHYAETKPIWLKLILNERPPIHPTLFPLRGTEYQNITRLSS